MFAPRRNSCKTAPLLRPNLMPIFCISAWTHTGLASGTSLLSINLYSISYKFTGLFSVFYPKVSVYRIFIHQTYILDSYLLCTSFVSNKLNMFMALYTSLYSLFEEPQRRTWVHNKPSYLGTFEYLLRSLKLLLISKTIHKVNNRLIHTMNKISVSITVGLIVSKFRAI
jgi:hypothetical protein